MQLVLEGGSLSIYNIYNIIILLYKPLTFEVGLIYNSVFIPVCSPSACRDVFNHNISVKLCRCTLVLFIITVLTRALNLEDYNIMLHG